METNKAETKGNMSNFVVEGCKLLTWFFQNDIVKICLVIDQKRKEEIQFLAYWQLFKFLTHIIDQGTKVGFSKL